MTRKKSKKVDTSEKSASLSPKNKKLFDNLYRVTLEFIQGKQFRAQTLEALVQRLHIHSDHVILFQSILSSLEKDKYITKTDGIYQLPIVETIAPTNSLKKVQGLLSVHPRGFGFINMPAPEEDIFIPKPFMNGAVDGDLVEIEFDPKNYSEKGPDGKVIAILQRGRKELAGTVTSVVDGVAYVYSSLLGETNLCECPLKPGQKIARGDRVLVEVIAWGTKKQPEKCAITKIIGHITDPLSDIPFAIVANGIRTDFPQKVLDEARSYGNRITPKDLLNRRDLRDLECFTIDPETAKDFDDALSLEQIGSRFRLGVHIADVSHYVRKDSPLDTEAQLRCNSTYFPGKCIPMIPHELSDNLCSLKPNVQRLTVSVFVEIDEMGKTVGWDIVKSVIKSQKRFTYQEAKLVLDGKKKSKHAPTLQLMKNLCLLLQNERAGRGSVQLSMPEMILKIDEQGMPYGTEIHQYDITHQLVEEFMLKANELVAIHLNRHGKDVTYRVHEEPAPESLRDFSLLVKAFGFTLPDTPTPHDIQKFFLELGDHRHAQYLSVSYIKSMRLACYSADNIGHYGLSLEHYCHFTSPIRRYVDTIAHRLLFSDAIAKDVLQDICLRASERERVSARAENSVMQIKKLRYLQKIQQENPHRQYEAVLSRIKPFGIYFDIVDMMIDGFLHISDLENDYFIFDDARNVLTGRHHGTVYQAGDKIIVMPKSIDLVTVEACWHMVGRVDEENTKEDARPIKSKTRSRKQSKKR